MIKVKNEVPVYERDCQPKKVGEPDYPPMGVTNHSTDSSKVNLLCGGIVLTVRGMDLIMAVENAMRWRSVFESAASMEDTPACKIEGHTIGGWDGEKHWCVECTAEVEKNTTPRKKGFNLGPPLEGRNFVFTGVMTQGTRPEYEERVKKLGGNVLATVSERITNCCVVKGKTPGSKFRKAQELSVTILTEKEFLEYLETFESSEKPA